MEVKPHYKGGSDPQGFDRISRELFAPIYPVIAKQIIRRTGRVDGYCLDVGCGTGALGRALADQTNLHITFFDQSPEMIDLSIQYVTEENLLDRSEFEIGDIHRLQFSDNTMDLVVSRGSAPFWEDWEKAYQEIFRVLKKDGHAYIGGGFGNAKLREEITQKMDREGGRRPPKEVFQRKKTLLPKILETLDATYANIIDDESGFWVHIMK
jgi:ubiquinone/menaquinone biosynthesis C-methylase UbiE